MLILRVEISRISCYLSFFSFFLCLVVEQLHNIKVYVGKKMKHKQYLCGTYMGPAISRGRVHILCTEPVVGQYVTIVKDTGDIKEKLVLCEVFVFGKPGMVTPYSQISLDN